MRNIELHTNTNYATLYHTYQLLYYKGRIQTNTITSPQKYRQKQYSNKVRNIELNTITNCTTLYHTYQLLYYKGHI